LKAAGAFVNEPVPGFAEAEKMLRMLSAMKKGSEWRQDLTNLQWDEWAWDGERGRYLLVLCDAASLTREREGMADVIAVRALRE
jgi:hypothetical protein